MSCAVCLKREPRGQRRRRRRQWQRWCSGVLCTRTGPLDTGCMHIQPNSAERIELVAHRPARPMRGATQTKNAPALAKRAHGSRRHAIRYQHSKERSGAQSSPALAKLAHGSRDLSTRGVVKQGEIALPGNQGTRQPERKIYKKGNDSCRENDTAAAKTER